MVEKGITMATNENELGNCIQSLRNSGLGLERSR
jgi:hypothetical protein